jgi:Ribbon-helix-helix domain
MTTRRQARRPKRKPRSGRPFMLYLRASQVERLNRLSRRRHVPKSELVRVAIDRFVASLEKSGPSESVGVAS